MNRTVSALVVALVILASQGGAQESPDNRPTPLPDTIGAPISVTKSAKSGTNSPSIEIRIIHLRYAKASYIKGILAEIASAADGDDVFKGTVKAVADDRTNLLIILTARENMETIERILSELDAQVKEETGVQPTPGGDSQPVQRGARTPQK
jgi:type II secretory pathway component GspD/PulD (secretin)